MKDKSVGTQQVSDIRNRTFAYSTLLALLCMILAGLPAQAQSHNTHNSHKKADHKKSHKAEGHKAEGHKAKGHHGSRLSFEQFKAPNGVTFEYTILKPESYNPEKTYPAILAFSPGKMNKESVTWAASNLWHSEAAKDWLIVIPTMPEQSWHTHPSHHALEAFLDKVRHHFKIENNKFHLAGNGDGARAAITYSGMSNKYFSTLTVANAAPWSKWSDHDLKRWCKDNKISVRIIVGDQDEQSMKSAHRVVGTFKHNGIDVSTRIIEGEGTKLKSLTHGMMLAEVTTNALGGH